MKSHYKLWIDNTSTTKNHETANQNIVLIMFSCKCLL